MSAFQPPKNEVFGVNAEIPGFPWWAVGVSALLLFLIWYVTRRPDFRKLARKTLEAQRRSSHQDMSETERD